MGWPPAVYVSYVTNLDGQRQPGAREVRPFVGQVIAKRTSERVSERAEDHGVALPAAAAKGCGADPASAAAQLVQQGQRQPVAAHADRVPEGDRPAIDGGQVVGDAEVTGGGDTDGRER